MFPRYPGLRFTWKTIHKNEKPPMKYLLSYILIQPFKEEFLKKHVFLNKSLPKHNGLFHTTMYMKEDLTEKELKWNIKLDNKNNAMK